MHVWDPHTHYYPWLCDERPIAFRYGDYSKLRRRYLVDEYRTDTAGWRVSHAVYVEAEWDPRDPLGEMDFVARMRKNTGFPTVAIAQAWLDRDDCAEVLESQARHAFVRGVRHKPKPGMMDDARWRGGYARLAPLRLHFELQVPFPQLEEAARLARDFADTVIVINHTGLPPSENIEGWRCAMAALAACPNVFVKISGMGAPRSDIVLTTIDLFGPQRAMFASNYPVDGLRASFTAIYSGFEEITRAMPDAQRRALFHDNAVRVYRME
jgi:predicted TIM-barrel fold metal-dependent hydrolase